MQWTYDSRTFQNCSLNLPPAEPGGPIHVFEKYVMNGAIGRSPFVASSGYKFMACRERMLNVAWTSSTGTYANATNIRITFLKMSWSALTYMVQKPNSFSFLRIAWSKVYKIPGWSSESPKNCCRLRPKLECVRMPQSTTAQTKRFDNKMVGKD